MSANSLSKRFVMPVSVFTMVNVRHIFLKMLDRPDSLRHSYSFSGKQYGLGCHFFNPPHACL